MILLLGLRHTDITKYLWLFIIYRRNQCQMLPVFVHLICEQWCYNGKWDILLDISQC